MNIVIKTSVVGQYYQVREIERESLGSPGIRAKARIVDSRILLAILLTLQYLI